jgi:hypothetical protein
VPDDGPPAAVVLLDVEAREITTFVGAEVARVPTRLRKYHVLIGLHLRETMRRLALPSDDWRLCDLKPPQKTRQLNRSGGKLRRRLEADAKALYAFYHYGALQNLVRLRWGFLDEHLGVEWRLPGELSLYEILDRARNSGIPVEVVVGSAPGWADPWARARRGRVRELGTWDMVLEIEGGEPVPIRRDEIQAVRLVKDGP